MSITGHFLIFYSFISVLFDFSVSTRYNEEGSEIGHPWIELGNKYYLISNGAKFNWYAAAHLCRLYDSFLVTIESDEEMDNLNSHLMKSGHDNRYWTSGNCLGQGRTFYSLTNGRPLVYMRWGPDQPNYFDDNQKCMEICYDDGSYAMNDYDCNAEFHYICERPKMIRTDIEENGIRYQYFPL